jgi:two-component system LytT family response regulator
MLIRALVVDDEPPARRKIRRFLEAAGDVTVVGEAGTGPDAVALLRATPADVLFLDISMPGLDGFGVLEALGDLGDLEVVFVTAYEEHALRAFAAEALDYLLKPVSEERLARVLERVRQNLRPAQTPVQAYWKRLLVQGPRLARFVQVAEIDWVEADRNYVVLHCGSQEHLIRSTMDAFAQRLDPNEFVRINRSTVVNLDRVRELQPWTHGEYKVILEGGKELMWSRRFVSAGLERFLPA